MVRYTLRLSNGTAFALCSCCYWIVLCRFARCWEEDVLMEVPEPSDSAEVVQRVLIADADPESAALAEATLTAAGYAVTVATSGAEALHFTDDDAPDLYVLDRDLPELD